MDDYTGIMFGLELEMNKELTLSDVLNILSDYDTENIEDENAGIFMDEDMKKAVPYAIRVLREYERDGEEIAQLEALSQRYEADAKNWNVLEWMHESGFADSYTFGYVMEHMQDFIDAYEKEHNG